MVAFPVPVCDRADGEGFPFISSEFLMVVPMPVAFQLFL